MTAVIHHGPPGSYKTFALVQRVLIPALIQGRVIVTNIRGFNDLDRIRTTMAVTIPESAAIYYIEPNAEGFETIAKFFHWVPAGALIAMDEGQRVYPTRDRGFKHLDLPPGQLILDAQGQPLLDVATNECIARPTTLENAFDQHRHFNWDIYISTPNISKIHGEIRGVVEWAYRHRNVSGLLPWLNNTWMEFRHDAESTGKAVAHYSGTPKKYKADHKVFSCYQSTATGTAKQSSENISVFRDPKLRMAFIVLVVALAFVVYNGIQAFQRMSKTAAPVDLSSAAVPGGVAPGHVSDPAPDPVSIPVAPTIDPLADSKIYYVGQFNSLIFEVELPDKTRQFLTYDDLRYLGYVLSKKMSSLVVLEFEGKPIYAWAKQPTAAPAPPAAMPGQAVPQPVVNML